MTDQQAAAQINETSLPSIIPLTCSQHENPTPHTNAQCTCQLSLVSLFFDTQVSRQCALCQHRYMYSIVHPQFVEANIP